MDNVVIQFCSLMPARIMAMHKSYVNVVCRWHFFVFKHIVEVFVVLKCLISVIFK